MNRLNLRYLIISFIATTVVGIGTELFIITLLNNGRQTMAGAALSGGWWANLATAAIVAIMGGRRAAATLIDPRLGKVVGTAMGVWVGVGAIFGQVLAALVLFDQVPNSDVRPGLILVFGLVSFGVCVLAGAIAGRETAHPPELEEET